MSVDDLAAIPHAGKVALREATVSASVDARIRLREMVVAHHATVWRFLRRLGLNPSDADDALQDVLLVVMRRLDTIAPGRERSFMLGTAYRVGSRSRKKRRTTGDEDLTDATPHPDVLVDQKRARELLDHILAHMTDDLRAVFVLHDVERLTMAEIAHALDLKPGTVASRLRRAREDFDKRVARAEAELSRRSR